MAVKGQVHDGQLLVWMSAFARLVRHGLWQAHVGQAHVGQQCDQAVQRIGLYMPEG